MPGRRKSKKRRKSQVFAQTPLPGIKFKLIIYRLFARFLVSSLHEIVPYDMMSGRSFGPTTPKSFDAYPRVEIDIESLGFRNLRRVKSSELKSPRMLKSVGNGLKYYYKLHPILFFLLCFSFGLTILILLSIYQTPSRYREFNLRPESYPFPKLKNLVMVAGHSVYTSSNCGKVDSENSWFLESYQKHPGQAATFLDHIKEGVEVAAKDDEALLLFSGGETRKDAGPRSEAQSYWLVAESKAWFGEGNVRGRALTEEHARDSFENLLFSVCRFRELTGTYPQNITVVSYDFKEDRFAKLHRLAIGFPETHFFYVGTPTSATSQSGARKGEALVRSQFEKDPYGCVSSLHHKKLRRDPFHRSIPYPTGCPEIEGLFKYCGTSLYGGHLPWA
ncbi:hypothetical protein KSS87_018850 [Heliosperma pusillum]|nr:hypothetical protein KSS87_018850 [Heliosperma pusillum]